ncbi:hypothetical protein [Rhodococcus sp. BP-241]|uniref:hypothetical protein n=1 Tax=Rhodococcus sp. BP-241 TaxID=2739441 RepID=UPI0027E1AC80|nr:hypothetical protein [Rhodococcus sp. BP-241]
MAEPFTKEEADQAEIGEARLLAKQRTSRAAVTCQRYWPSNFDVCGAIRDKYNSLGAQFSFLLLPTSGNIVNPGNTGERVTFMNGPIYWSAAGGAHPVVNSFLNRWGILGYEGSYLKYPTTDEIVLPDGGRRQEFQDGAIYVAFQNAIGSAIQNGPLRDKYNSVGGLTPGSSFLGYLTGDHIRTLPDGQGQMARFQNGVIYWSPATGAWPVTGRILDQWAGVGYETGPLRYPTAEQVDNGVTIEQSFQGGKLETPGANAVELATQNPGTTAQEMIDEAIFNAQQRALDVADVILEAVEGGRIETLASDPVTGSPTTLPFARGAGDIFYADADTANVNHGHNGIFISTTETVEALNPTKGVQLTDNTTGNPDGTRRTVYGPKMMFVNTSSGVRANAVFFALNQVGKDYNSNFAFNKRFINGDAYNCSSLVWAAFQSASGGGVDLDQEPGGGEDATPSGIFPNEIVKSDWTTLYP